jgi:predicted Zn-dependent protease with MMP-like domain
MKPQAIAITRKFNLGNYQTMDITVQASLNEGEDPVQALHALEKLIMDYWEGKASSLISKQIGEKK